MPDKIKPTQKDILRWFTYNSRMEVNAMTAPVKRGGDSFYFITAEPSMFRGFPPKLQGALDKLCDKGLLEINQAMPQTYYRLTEAGWNQVYPLSYKLTQIKALEAHIRARQDDVQWYGLTVSREHDIQQCEMEIARLELTLSADDLQSRINIAYVALNDAWETLCEVSEREHHTRWFSESPSQQLATTRVTLRRGTWQLYQYMQARNPYHWHWTDLYDGRLVCAQYTIKPPTGKRDKYYSAWENGVFLASCESLEVLQQHVEHYQATKE